MFSLITYYYFFNYLKCLQIYIQNHKLVCPTIQKYQPQPSRFLYATHFNQPLKSYWFSSKPHGNGDIAQLPPLQSDQVSGYRLLDWYILYSSRQVNQKISLKRYTNHIRRRSQTKCCSPRKPHINRYRRLSFPSGILKKN